MATLTEAAYYTRNTIKYGTIGIIVIVILRISFAIFSTWWKTTHPPPPPPATVAFGKLPPIPFPQQEKPEITFSLETVTGTTGDFDPNVNVYVVPAERGRFLAFERATELAQTLEFLFEPERASETVYRWTKDKPLPSTLEFDILTGHFTFNANWRVQPQLIAEAQALSEVEAVAEARSWLSSMRLLSEDLEAGRTEVSYLKVSGTQIVPALSQSEAQFTRVDLYRSNLIEDEEVPDSPQYRILPLDSTQGIVTVVILKQRRTRILVIRGIYRYIPVDYERSATYPLLSSKIAWERLQKGEAYFAVIPEGLSSIAIRRIRLEYLDPPQAGIFLYPIYVFEGDGGFVGYVTAVSDEEIESSE